MNDAQRRMARQFFLEMPGFMQGIYPVRVPSGGPAHNVRG
jgi:hypothetical protein